MFASSSADALRKAEAAKTAAITESHQIGPAAHTIAEQARQTFAPRLVVIQVATSVWQPTVSALARVAEACIIDVSEPTEHLLWELYELERSHPGRWIVIGEHQRVAVWANRTADSFPAGSIDARAAALLDARDVLAYTTDRRGMRRFARALHGMLLDIADGPNG